MNLSLSHCFITVHNKDEALGFYRDKLGLEVRNDVPFGGTRWLTVGAPSQPNMEIVIVAPSDNPNTTPADQAALQDLLVKGMLGCLIFVTDNCDSTFEQLRSAGAQVMQEPVDQPYGVRDCAFQDPSGNMVRFSEIVSS